MTRPRETILSEDAFDVNVKEEGVAEHDENRGRIFAGGIGTDSEGKIKIYVARIDQKPGGFCGKGN